MSRNIESVRTVLGSCVKSSVSHKIMALPFEYSPLDPSDSRAFRILYLLPSLRDEDPILCELENHSLDEAIKYEALSYAWGQAAPTCPIIINGQGAVNVTESCVEALRSLRRKVHRRTLWVDAICINQHDSDTSKRERNHQVKFMFEIFKKAQNVLVWLGPEEPGTARTIRILKLLFALHPEKDRQQADATPRKMNLPSVSRMKASVARRMCNQICTYALLVEYS
jgi:hypothetical protein